MGQSLQITVVIPTFRRRETLASTLAAYDRQVGFAGCFEVVVVVDGDDDGTADLLERLAGTVRFPLRHHVLPRNGGPSAARNQALRMARGDVVLIAGDDIVPAPDLLVQHWTWHAERFPGADVAVLGHVAWAREIAVTKLMRWLEASGSQFAYGRIRHGEAVGYGHLYTSNVSLKRRFILDSGEFFDERLRFCEDSEWGERLFRRGLSLRYNAEAVGHHLHPTTLAASLRRMEEVGRAVRTLRTINPDNFRRLTSGVFEPAQRRRRAMLQLLLHPRLGAALYTPLARLCEHRVAADRVFALSHAASLLKGLGTLDAAPAP